MRAAVYKSAEKPLGIETVEDPRCTPQGLVVKVAYCGICGTDLHAAEGKLGVCPGSVLGHEFSGTVVEVGAEAKDRFKIDDKVVALPFIACGSCLWCKAGEPYHCGYNKVIGLELPGGFAEYVATSSHETLKIPDSLTLQQAAVVEPLAVGVRAVRKAGLKLGDRVVVLGAGPIGLGVTLWARMQGCEVVVVELTTQRKELASNYGATVLSPHENLKEQINHALNGEADTVFECVGKPGMLQQCLDLVKSGGRVCGTGVVLEEDYILPTTALFKEISVDFVVAYSREDFQTTLNLLGDGRLKVRDFVSSVVSLNKLPDALLWLQNPEQHTKILVDLSVGRK